MRYFTFPILLMLIILSVALKTTFGQSSDEGYLMVRVLESWDKAYSLIVVTEDDKIIDTIKLDMFHYKNNLRNQTKINKVINHYENNGYDLYNVTASSTNIKETHITTYLFQKEE